MKDVISVDELAKLFANRIGSPYGEGATYSHSQAEPEDESDKPKANGRLYSHLDDEDFELFVRDFKSEVHSLLISKLPEKKPLVLEKEYSTPRELLPQEQEIKLNTNHQVIGFNQAVDNMNRVIDEMFEAKS